MLGQYVVDVELFTQATINADKGQLSVMNDGTPDANTAVSSIHVLTDVSFSVTFVLSSITIEPTVFVGNWEASLIRKKDCAHVHRWCATAHSILASLWSCVSRGFDAGFLAFKPCYRRRRLTVWALTLKVEAVIAGIKNGSFSCAWTISSSCSSYVVLHLPDPFFLFTVPSSSNLLFILYTVFSLTAKILATLEGLIPAWRCPTSLALSSNDNFGMMFLKIMFGYQSVSNDL